VVRGGSGSVKVGRTIRSEEWEKSRKIGVEAETRTPTPSRIKIFSSVLFDPHTKMLLSVSGTTFIFGHLGLHDARSHHGK